MVTMGSIVGEVISVVDVVVVALGMARMRKLMVFLKEEV